MTHAYDILAAIRRALAARTARGLSAEFLEADEVAALFHIHVYTVYRYIRRGRLPAIRSGRRFLIPAAALERLAEEAMEAINR